MKTEFTLKNATSHAGSKPLLAYLEKIKLEDTFRQIGCGKGRNTLFPFFKILMYLLVGWLLGCERIFHFRSLRDDSLRSEEHTSELQSREKLVCRLLLEKNKQ